MGLSRGPTFDDAIQEEVIPLGEGTSACSTRTASPRRVCGDDEFGYDV